MSQISCCFMKISDQNERDSGLSQGDQMTNLDLQKNMVFHLVVSWLSLEQNIWLKL